MRQIMVRYKVKPDRVAENEKLVRAVFDEMHRTKPTGMKYATFQLEDGVSFVHLLVETGEGTTGLLDLEAFRQFQEGIGDRCDEAPGATGLREIGSYRLLDA